MAAAAAQAAAAGKLPVPVGPMDGRPGPPGTPVMMDPNALRYVHSFNIHLYVLYMTPHCHVGMGGCQSKSSPWKL